MKGGSKVQGPGSKEKQIPQTLNLRPVFIGAKVIP
jgi:hypothetical protein